MTNNKPSRSNYPKHRAPHPFTEKPLTEYKPALALKRIRFYLDVLEAHFTQLTAVLESAHAEGKTTIPNPFRAEADSNTARQA
jgi:hypothetical protein